MAWRPSRSRAGPIPRLAGPSPARARAATDASRGRNGQLRGGGVGGWRRACARHRRLHPPLHPRRIVRGGRVADRGARRHDPPVRGRDATRGAPGAHPALGGHRERRRPGRRPGGGLRHVGLVNSAVPADPLSGGLTIGFKTTPIDVTWEVLDSIWAAAGELGIFGAGWMADHLTDATRERGGQSWEAFTLMAGLAHRVPGKWLGHAVLANTFRQPALVAKQATVMDHVTGGRFIVGLGAGWHEGEHEAFGIPLS